MSDDTIKKNISKNISKYREAAGISQKDLAKNSVLFLPEFLIGKQVQIVPQ